MPPAKAAVEARRKAARPEFDAWLAAATPDAVAKSLPQAGTYTGVYPFSTHQRWLRNAAQLRNLDELVERVRHLEAKLGKDKGNTP